MNRINQKGTELINYKTELLNNYPELVKKSLLIAIEQMVENKVIDLDAYEFVKQESIGLADLEAYLQERADFLKTDEEVFAEFEMIREMLNLRLKEKGMEHLKTESVINKDAIVVIKNFCIDENFTLSYFGVEEKDLLKLMKRRGFVEKFSVLRLTAIFKTFMEKVEFPEELFACYASPVYFDKTENGYSIDIAFELSIEDVEKEERIEEMCEAIQKIVQDAVAHYEERVKA